MIGKGGGQFDVALAEAVAGRAVDVDAAAIGVGVCLAIIIIASLLIKKGG